MNSACGRGSAFSRCSRLQGLFRTHTEPAQGGQSTVMPYQMTQFNSYAVAVARRDSVGRSVVRALVRDAAYSSTGCCCLQQNSLSLLRFVGAFRTGLSRRCTSRCPWGSSCAALSVPSDMSQPDSPSVSPSSATLATIYGGLLTAYLTIAACMMLFPGACVEILHGVPRDPILVALLGIKASMLLPAAAAVATLRRAVQRSVGLASRTYLRLNLSLIVWAFTLLNVNVLSFIPGVVPLPLMTGVAALMLCTICAAALGALEYPNDGLRIDKLLAGLVEGMQYVFTPTGPLNAAYSVGAVGAACCAVALLFTSWTPLFIDNVSAAGLLLKRAAGAGLLLVTGLYYCLHDAAKRKKVGASAFRNLNLGIAAAAAAQMIFFIIARISDDAAIASSTFYPTMLFYMAVAIAGSFAFIKPRSRKSSSKTTTSTTP